MGMERMEEGAGNGRNEVGIGGGMRWEWEEWRM